MFKERLKQTFEYIFVNLIAPIIALAVFATILLFVSIKVPVLIIISFWGIGIFLAIVLLLGLIIFIYWLFIEPFKKQKV